MSRILITAFCFATLIACGDNNVINEEQLDQLASTDNTTSPADGVTASAFATEIALADGFCRNQKKLQIISTSLLSAYSPKGNGSDLNYCGGENIFTVDGLNFSLQMNDYCVNARGQQVILNGSINGATESGSNFVSNIINNLSIVGDNIDLTISGDSRDGRANDNFMNLQITDNIEVTSLAMNDISIKKGEFDFGFFTFDNLQKVAFSFITHFNEDNTEGLLFIYGDAEERLIISGDNGMITAVHTVDRQDQGTWLNLPCNDNI